MPVPDSPTIWHTVRPWTPRFTLVVREVTSVSATFVLTPAASSNSTGSTNASAPAKPTTKNAGDGPTLESIRLDATLNTNVSSSGSSAMPNIVTEAYNRGLTVTVNGAQWKRVLMRMDESHGEAVIVIFGLMPARQYDVELGIVLGETEGEEVVHSRMVTQAQQNAQTVPEADADRSIDSISSVSSYATDAVSPSRTSSSHSSQPTLEEYAATLRNTLAQLNAEHSSLMSQLKGARRDSQKADGALRQEIESLKRAGDKHAAVETRGRQKVLALQEAVKQANTATHDTEAEAAQLEASLPAIRAREKQAEATHKTVSGEASKHQAEYDSAIAQDRAKTGGLESEMNALTARLEKLKAKKEKLSGETLSELGRKLEGLVREVALVERDAGAFEVIDTGPVGVGLGSSSGRNSSTTPRVSPPLSGLGVIGASRPPGLPPKPQTTRTLSSRAPPFDPSAFRQRPALTQSSSKSSGSSGSVHVNSSGLHSHAQSIDVGGGPTVNIVTPIRPPSPVRQTSLPMKMPSYSGKET